MIDYEDFETVDEIDKKLESALSYIEKDNIINIETIQTGFFRVWYRC